MEICKQLFRRLTTALTILLMAFVLVKSSTDMYYNYISGNTQHLTYICWAAALCWLYGASAGGAEHCVCLPKRLTG